MLMTTFEKSELWDGAEKRKALIDAQTIREQDDLAQKSSVFAKILAYERAKGGVEVTNHPKSLVRNAMISRSCYPDIKSWEKNLETSEYYAEALSSHTT